MEILLELSEKIKSKGISAKRKRGTPEKFKALAGENDSERKEDSRDTDMALSLAPWPTVDGLLSDSDVRRSRERSTRMRSSAKKNVATDVVDSNDSSGEVVKEVNASAETAVVVFRPSTETMPSKSKHDGCSFCSRSRRKFI
ncbi:hypothetical protein M569_12648 [Genlisea aurea]|uniref:Uncharacterized protein n=1 Tax=Genlisea aurea TaxID=192259 RepID=S8C5P8_9LAMI|nr:hypothetical protein M569_12648 [Genlisea aurea]